MVKFSGACLCGAIHYSADAEPIFMGLCHCRDCQRATGSAFAAAVCVPDAAVTMEGSPKSFTVKGESGLTVTRSFCPDCGSTMMTRAQALPGAVLLSTGPMDDASTAQFKPAMETFCASAQPWVSLEGETHRFPAMPPA